MTEAYRILYAWELGSNYGHVSTFLPLARRLRADGHEVLLALRDLSRVQALPGIGDFEVLQAPTWQHEVQGLPEPQVCYADIMQRNGYHDVTALTSLFRSWRALLQRLQPDLLITDHAPTALFASRGLGFPRAMFGSGFFSPPRTTPLPSMRPLLQVAQERLASSERTVLETMNRVLETRQLPLMHNLAELFDVEGNWLISMPEFDHYWSRGPARYYGPLLSLAGGVEPDWPDTPGPKLFVYVKPDSPHTRPLLAQLRGSRFSVLAHIPGLSPEQRSSLASPGLRISTAPLDMARVCASADAVVCNAGLGTVMQACLAGLPVLALPMYVEQTLTARNVERAGVGRMVLNGDPSPDFVRLLDDLVENPGWRRQVQALAGKYTEYSQPQILDSLASCCAALLAQSRMQPAP